MNITAWALVPVASMLVAATAGVLIVGLALKDTASRDRATILRAVAEVIRALRGRG